MGLMWGGVTFLSTHFIAHQKGRHENEAVLKEYKSVTVAAIFANAKTQQSVDVIHPYPWEINKCYS